LVRICYGQLPKNIKNQWLTSLARGLQTISWNSTKATNEGGSGTMPANGNDVMR
jgi:hypothetical protein